MDKNQFTTMNEKIVTVDNALSASIDALETALREIEQVEQLKKDLEREKARLDWLLIKMPDEVLFCSVGCPDHLDDPDEWRAVIDKAMGD